MPDEPVDPNPIDPDPSKFPETVEHEDQTPEPIAGSPS